MYSLLICDCPWSYNDKASAGNRGAEFKYPCMPLQDLANMDTYIDSIAHNDSVLYMWTTGPMMPEAITLMAAWHYTYKTIAFTWIKTNKNPCGKDDNFRPMFLETYEDLNHNIITVGDFMSMGNHTRSNAEFVLLGIRGKGVKRVSASVRSTIISPVREHSRKPDEIFSRLDTLYGDIPKIELFSREKRPGWDQHGNQTEMFNTN